MSSVFTHSPMLFLVANMVDSIIAQLWQVWISLSICSRQLYRHHAQSAHTVIPCAWGHWFGRRSKCHSCSSRVFDDCCETLCHWDGTRQRKYRRECCCVQFHRASIRECLLCVPLDRLIANAQEMQWNNRNSRLLYCVSLMQGAVEFLFLSNPYWYLEQNLLELPVWEDKHR